jgi:hypothetical protein
MTMYDVSGAGVAIETAAGIGESVVTRTMRSIPKVEVDKDQKANLAQTGVQNRTYNRLAI